MKVYRVGMDVGSTTAKVVVIDEREDIILSKYLRHCANIPETIDELMRFVIKELGDVKIRLSIAGSVGMGIAERFGFPFVQEVSAMVEVVRRKFDGISTIIDIGGEDSKIVYLNEDGNIDLRMNGNCAGGTGSFIDQMATIIDVPVEDLDALARKSNRIHPIASRCGVFSKTDIQNLISKNVDRTDIAMSVFHAVAVQTVVTLSRGNKIEPKILFCGGPLMFIPSLRKAFHDYLELEEGDTITPENAHLFPAYGAAMNKESGKAIKVSEVIKIFEGEGLEAVKITQRLDPIFSSEKEYSDWLKEKAKDDIEVVSYNGGDIWLGIDSGSTTTKIVGIDNEERVVYSFYSPNYGDPISTTRTGLKGLLDMVDGEDVVINAGCSTGYGEDLIKAAFNLEAGIIETIGHYSAAKKISPEVSFVLDIGGQDMKAMFIENGALNRMEINEACSSGCGSFLETFAISLGQDISEFAQAACRAESPCDLGTRCTVFMNSKIKQVLREGASIEDISAGLSYSVVKNCLYKVLNVKNADELGDSIVLQGGTMKNDSVVRAFELLTDRKVYRTNISELMGAYGAAIYAKNSVEERRRGLRDVLATAEFETKEMVCRGCENNCLIYKYTFANDNVFYSGNKCENIFTNAGEDRVRGRNIYPEKYDLIFDRKVSGNGLRIGIPRVLNIFENYPFWHALFEEVGMEVVLSDTSLFGEYEKGVHSVMSDNICFPAKLTHSHIYDLINKDVDRIFFPYVVFEQKENPSTVNTYNCPIVTGYSDVIKSAINPQIPIDSPVFSFKEEKLLRRNCTRYLLSLGVEKRLIGPAITQAIKAQSQYENEIKQRAEEIYSESGDDLCILLAGRPYHTDPLIQHKLSEMIADMGVNVISEDILRGDKTMDFRATHYVSQWAYINRILGAAEWVGRQGDNIHFVQMTSFGCGPDAFLLDEVKALLKLYGKSLTILKIDDVNNIGSLKLRVRSLIESLDYDRDGSKLKTNTRKEFVTTKVFTKKERKRKIIAPYFTDFASPLMNAFFKNTGYDIEILPESDTLSAEYGLKYANNEVCYPATLIIGDIIKALKSGKYDLSNTAVAMTQTGGQCRASNYLPMIKSALVEAGFEEVPVISVALGDGMTNEQTGFKINWVRHIRLAVYFVLFGDVISKFYYAALVREKEEGMADKLKDYYLELGNMAIRDYKPRKLKSILRDAARDFNSIIEDKDLPKVGVVGEIFLKFNSFSHKRILTWLTDRKYEVIPPMLSDFFFQAFVNMKVKHKEDTQKNPIPEWAMDAAYSMVRKTVKSFNKIGSEFRYYIPFNDVFDLSEDAKEVISLSAQFGEGWLLPGEIVNYVKNGVNNVLSLQPFGCIANHVVSRGVEKKIKALYPKLNLLSLDFDSGVSDVNVINRLHLMTDNIQ